MSRCPICDGHLRQHLTPWLRKCDSCGFLQSELEPAISDEAHQNRIDETFRADALYALRTKTFNMVAETLRKHVSDSSPAVLDVGSAHGWFLEAATTVGFSALGLEPDERIAALATDRGLDTRVGYFPDALLPDEKFDAITFNDVFEHLPDVHGALAAATGRLKPGGVLVLNLPSATGPFYRFAEVLARLGVRSPLDRMWQKGFASPHISYFAPSHLIRLAAQHNLQLVEQQRVRSVAITGLWSRLRYEADSSMVRNVVVWLAVLVLSPLLAILPSDTNAFYFTARPGPQQ